MLPAQARVQISNHQSEPLTSLPKTLKTWFTSENVKTLNDAFVLALHSFMLEAGFLPKDVSDGNHLEILPQTWQSNKIYKFKYYHVTCPEICCLMTCIPLGHIITTFGTVEDVRDFRETSITLRLSDYVTDGHGLSDPTQVYQNLKALSQIFKGDFALRLLASLQDVLGFGPTFGISVLMEHLKMEILSYLPVESLVAMSATNKEFNELCNSVSLWRNLYWKHFANVVDFTDVKTDWKEMYKAKYMKQKCKQRLFFPLSNYPSINPNLGFHHPNFGWHPLFREQDDSIPFYGDIGIPAQVQLAFPNLVPRISPANRIFHDLMSGNASLRYPSSFDFSDIVPPH